VTGAPCDSGDTISFSALSRSPGLARGEVAAQEPADSLDEGALAQRAARTFVAPKDLSDRLTAWSSRAVLLGQALRPRAHAAGNPLAQPLPLRQVVRTAGPFVVPP